MSEMTYEQWNRMSATERREWNRPAFNAFGVSDTEWLVSDGNWGHADDVDTNLPHRVKPIDTPVAQPEPAKDVPTQAERRAAWVMFATSCEVSRTVSRTVGAKVWADKMLAEYDKRFGGAK